MNQRFTSPRKHPMTGKHVEPLWFDQNGFAFYPIMGAAPDDPLEGTPKEGEGSEGESGKEGTEGQPGENGKDGSITAEEHAALKVRMQAADRRATEAEKKAKELEDKDKSEETKRQERLVAVESENTDLKKQVRDLNLKNAFLSSNDVVWHDPDVALSQADLSEVMNDKGEVDKAALKKALENLAKSKAFLVKTEAGGDGQKDKSGETVGSGRKGDKKEMDEDALRRKYPSLI